MQFNRRNFIKLVIGGAAGIGLTPLPWKLTDDIAIWTQNWPWVPIPPVGAFTHVKTICSLCPGACGIEVRKVDERAVKIEGRTDSPVNPGGICPLGIGGLQMLYNESIRYTVPMKRMGQRGEGKFLPITWNEAVDILANRISVLRKEGRPEGLVAIDGHHQRSTLSSLIQRLLTSVGSPNYVRIPSAEDTCQMSALLTMGTEGPVSYDLENADFILSFGSGLLEGWGAPGRVLNAWGLWHEDTLKEKTRVVQIESRASRTASKSDQWIPARPGSEVALALGLCNVIIRDDLYDSNFINTYSFGFDDWKSPDGKKHKGFKTIVLEDYSFDRVAGIAGLDPKEIVRLARDFSKARAPIAVCGKGKGTLNGSLFEFMAVHYLNALVGNINKPGGVFIHEPLPDIALPEPEVDSIAAKGLGKARLDQAGSSTYPFSHSLIHNLSESILKGPKDTVDTMMIFAANPVFTLPDGGSFKDALNKVPFVVSFSPFRDETSQMADLILPDHTYLEKMDDMVWPTGLNYPIYGLSQPVVTPIYNTRNSGDVIIQLSKKIDDTVGASFPLLDFEDALKKRAMAIFKEDFSNMWLRLKSGEIWHGPAIDSKKNTFKTPTGKFEFQSTKIEAAINRAAKESTTETALKNMGITASGDMSFMAHYEILPSNTDRATYPLRIIPYELLSLSSGWVPNPPFLNKALFDHQLIKDESFAEINPITASEYTLRQGDRIVVKSPVGEVRVRVNIFEGAMPGIIYLPLGFGHTAYDEFLKGKGVNPNTIIQTGKDPISGFPIWWNTPVQISKV